MNKLEKFKKVLKIKDPILGIHFLNKLPAKFKHYQDTVCTALARAFIKREALVFDAKKYPQLCPGGNYFLKLSKVSDQEAINTYVKNEQVFKNKNVCQKFLKSLPKIPSSLKKKFIFIKPLTIRDKPLVVILLVNSAQAGRIIGLVNYDQYKEIEIQPNQPTCISLFAPLVTKKPHLNFLDYYDRYYQGKVKGKNIWPEDKMIISLTYDQFKAVLNNFQQSPQGNFKPKLQPQSVDKV